MQDQTETQSTAIPDKFRHIAFITAIILFVGAWKFALEGVFEGD